MADDERDPRRPASSRGPGDGADPAGGADGRDLDAEFAAMMAGLDLPGTGDPADDDPPSQARGATGTEDEEAGGAGHGVDLADVPRNAYRRAGTGPGELSEEDRADLEALGRAGEGSLPKAVKIAVVLTPLASAEALAALCAMSDLACWVVPARSGAYAVKEFVSAHAEWDVAELLSGVETEPAEAAELAGALSRLARAGVVLLTADLATDIGIESGLSGHITARHYVGGQAGQDASAGLVMSAVDASVEDVLLGIVKASDVPGALDTTNVPRARSIRFLGRGLRRPRGPQGRKD